ncbi:replication protein RepA [Prosthecomicrobium hirschii]|uniref:replication protein RepA n=1 Tax=Prosthecodimorpha hirschii TaxID=665126 RepID=UPI00221F1CAD|nr:replication protein RepA [Prosthecomicrobium hirschii]MCW1844210.1 replication protein RepA [Prosthecomicrobium hirschii]
MTRADESLIRDDDLRTKLEEARRRGFAFEQMVGVLVTTQKERDQAHQAEAAKAAKLAAMPRDRRRRFQAKEVIETEGPSPANLRYMPTPLAICGLPYKALPAESLEFERTQGRMAVTVTAGKLRAPDGRRVQQPVPWGPKARLIIAHLSTEALRNRSPIIETSETLSGFMRDMGFEPRGGARGNIEPFKEQLRALAACRMEISAWDGKRSGTVDVKPLEKVELWFGDHPDQTSLWPTKVAFSRAFYDELEKHALPIDVRVLRALSNSARRLDLMMWITYRITRLQTRLVLDWHPLKDQFGEGYTRDRDFRSALVEDLAALKELFPKMPVKLTERGLEMEAADASALAIPKRTLIS